MNTKFVKLIKIYIWYFGQLFIDEFWTSQILDFLSFNSSKLDSEPLDGFNLKNH
jgi:hypothetical protein